MEESFKRTRTSPRILVLNEVQGIIDSYIDALFDGETSINPTLLKLREIRGKVEALREGHPKSGKKDTSDTVDTASITGVHFVGVRSSDNQVIYLRRGSKGYHSDNGEADSKVEPLSAIYGAFNTEAGARYALEHNTYNTRPRVL